MTYTPNYERILTGLGIRHNQCGAINTSDYYFDEGDGKKRALADKCDTFLYAKGYDTNLNHNHVNGDDEEWVYFAVPPNVGSILEARAPTRELAILNVFEQFLEKEGK